MGENTAALVLGLISGIFILIISIIFLIAGLYASSVPYSYQYAYGSSAASGLLAIWGIFGVIDGILLILGSILVRNPNSAKTGAILILVFGILGFFTPVFGVIIFPILAIVGGAIGLSGGGSGQQEAKFVPAAQQQNPPAAPPNANQSAVQYIKEQKAAGYKMYEIRDSLRGAGYSDTEIDASLSETKKGKRR